MHLDVVTTAEAVVPARLQARTVLVVDVLRASTTMVAALGHGAAAIVPVATPEEARERAGAAEPGCLVAGERRGEKVDGFDLGNSPLEFTAERVAGRTIMFTTSNGTRALLASREATAIGIAAFVNAAAAAAWAVDEGRDLTIVCAGDRGRHSMEDHVCAGLLVDRVVAAKPAAACSPAAEAAVSEARGYGTEVARLAVESPWARRLVAGGLGDDVAACLVLDTSRLVPVYLPGVDKVVLAPR
jgi:2-phosphosulfolactate phosphatase